MPEGREAEAVSFRHRTENLLNSACATLLREFHISFAGREMDKVRQFFSKGSSEAQTMNSEGISYHVLCNLSLDCS